MTNIRYGRGQRTDGYTEWTPTSNYIYDIQQAILPGVGFKAVCRVWRRTKGYQLAEAAIPVDEFAEGRRGHDGQIIELSAGMSKSAASTILTALVAGRILLASLGPGGVKVYHYNDEIDEHNYAPLWPLMDYRELAEYVAAAGQGFVAPPATADELALLREACDRRHQLAQKQDAISLPAGWPSNAAGGVPHENPPVRTGVPHENPALPTAQRGSPREPLGSPPEPLGSPREPYTPEILRPDAGFTTSKETSKETSKQKSTGGDAPPAVAPPASKKKQDERDTKPSFDERPPLEWFAELRRLGVYPDMQEKKFDRYRDNLCELRVKYPVEVVAEFYRLKQAEKGARLYPPDWLALDITKWDDLDAAVAEWAAAKFAPDTPEPPAPEPPPARDFLAERAQRDLKRQMVEAQSDPALQQRWRTACRDAGTTVKPWWGSAILLPPPPGSTTAVLAFETEYYVGQAGKPIEKGQALRLARIVLRGVSKVAFQTIDELVAQLDSTEAVDALAGAV